MRLYKPVEVTVADSQRAKLIAQINQKYLPVKIVVKGTAPPTHTLLLTRGQIAKIEKAREIGNRKYKTIRLSRKQIVKNRNYQGGSLDTILNEEAENDTTKQSLPVIGIESKKDATDDGVYLVKYGHTMKIFPVQENGLFLQMHPSTLHETFADGLYVKRGNIIENGKTVLSDENGPFKKIPILQWIL